MIRSLLTGKKVKLAMLSEQDIPTVMEWYQDVEYIRHLDARAAFPQREGFVRDLIEANATSKSAYSFGIRLLDTNELIGIIELEGILWNHGTSVLAISIGPKAQRGKGYAKEALQLLLDFAFNELNLHRVSLSVFEYNEPAIKLYESLRFTREGVWREFAHRDGKRYDMILFSMLRPEWEALARE